MILRRSLRCAALLLTAATSPVAQEPPPDDRTLAEKMAIWHQELRGELVAAATRAPWIDVSELAYARRARVTAPPAMLQAHRQARAAVDAFRHAPEAARPLLDHAEPKVRIWAAFVLLRSLRAEFLPELGTLCSDTGEFPTAGGLSASWTPLGEAPQPPETTPMQVGECVRRFLSLWEGPQPGTDSYATWCEQLLAHQPTARGLQLEFLLRTGGQLNPRYWEPDDLFAVWNACGTARPGAAEIARIALLHEHTGLLVGAMPSVESDLEFDARRLGRENLLRLLAGEAPVIAGEPLDPIHFEPLLPGLQTYVLARPARLGLRPEDARRLLEIGRADKRLELFHGAARLRPQRATSILRECMDRNANPWMPAGAPSSAYLLWDLQPAQNVEFLEDWFHEDPPGGIRRLPDHRHDFLQHLLTGYQPADRGMFARLVHDPRFERCPPHSLQWVCRAFNRIAFEPPVDPQLFVNFMHPWGLEDAFAKPDAAAEAFPAQTREMLRRMDAMRAALRAASEGWLER